jgi:hypothetical protein
MGGNPEEIRSIFNAAVETKRLPEEFESRAAETVDVSHELVRHLLDEEKLTRTMRPKAKRSFARVRYSLLWFDLKS